MDYRATDLVVALGTSVTLLTNPQPALTPGYREVGSATSPNGLAFDQETAHMLADWNLLSDRQADDEPRQLEIDYSHMALAASEAAGLPDITLSEEDFRAIMGANTSFTRAIELDSDLEE